MAAKMGRPSTNPKNHETRIRMSDEDVEILEFCCKFFNKTKSEIIRDGIREMYKKTKK